jgi:hypothetical protein
MLSYFITFFAGMSVMAIIMAAREWILAHDEAWVAIDDRQ